MGQNNPFEYLNRAFPKWQTIGKTLKNRELSIYYYNPNITKPYLWLLNHPISSRNENNAKEYFSK